MELGRMPKAQLELRKHDHSVDTHVVCTLEAKVPALGCAVHGRHVDGLQLHSHGHGFT